MRNYSIIPERGYARETYLITLNYALLGLKRKKSKSVFIRIILVFLIFSTVQLDLVHWPHPLTHGE